MLAEIYPDRLASMGPFLKEDALRQSDTNARLTEPPE